MKHTGSERRYFAGLNLIGTAMILIAISAGCRTGPGRQAAENSTVVRLRGATRFSSDAKTWQTAAVGNELPAGCLIQTARDSRLDIELGRAPAPQPLTAVEKVPSHQVVLWENAVLKIEQLMDGSPEQPTKLDLRAGEMTCAVSAMKQAAFEIRINNNLLRTHGGEFYVKASGEVHALKGSVTLEDSAAGGPIEIAASHYYDPVTGSVKEEAPVRAHPARREGGGFDELSESFEQRRNVVWTATPKRR